MHIVATQSAAKHAYVAIQKLNMPVVGTKNYRGEDPYVDLCGSKYESFSHNTVPEIDRRGNSALFNFVQQYVNSCGSKYAPFSHNAVTEIDMRENDVLFNLVQQLNKEWDKLCFVERCETDKLLRLQKHNLTLPELKKVEATLETVSECKQDICSVASIVAKTVYLYVKCRECGSNDDGVVSSETLCKNMNYVAIVDGVKKIQDRCDKINQGSSVVRE